MMQQHYVTFLSPGTFFHEESTEKVDSWDVEKAKELSKTILERYNSKPFCFYFTTRTRQDDELDAKQTARSHRYFLADKHAKVRTLAQVEADNDPKEEILRSNMRINGYDRVITTNTPWRSTNVLEDDDIVLQVD